MRFFVFVGGWCASLIYRRSSARSGYALRMALSSEALRARFEADGFVVIEGWLSLVELNALRCEADECTSGGDTAAALSRGCIFETAQPAGACSRRDFLARRGGSPAVHSLLFGAKLRELAHLLLSPSSATLCLFNEQFICKPAHSGSAAAFAWHRDSQWCEESQARYISIWVALDDMSEENGTLCIKPGSHLGSDESREPYIVTVDAGAAVVLCDAVLHASGRNLSDAPRRAWMPQFSDGAVLEAGRAQMHAVPLNS